MKSCFSMFKNCNNLINIDLSSFDSSNVTNMKEMFAGIGNNATILNLDLSGLETTIG